MQIIDVTNPSDISVIGSAQVNGDKGVDIFVEDSTNRAYLVTANSASQDELFVIDITTKTGLRGSMGSHNTNGMDPRGITKIEEGPVIIVGYNGQEYQVVEFTTETNPVKCGGIDIDTGINGISSLNDFDGTAFSYIITKDSTSELKVIRGGLGGGFGNGYGYSTEGFFISSVFDTGDISNFFAISWDETPQANSNLEFQVRAGNSSDLSAVSWVGPDGTSGSYFGTAMGEGLPSVIQNNRYIQYRARFQSDSIDTHILEAVRINYEY
jgi:hypothetical protein